METAGVNSTVTTTVDDGLKVFFQGDVKIYFAIFGRGIGWTSDSSTGFGACGKEAGRGNVRDIFTIRVSRSEFHDIQTAGQIYPSGA